MDLLGKKLKIYDDPSSNQRKIHQNIISRTGGLGIFLAYFICYFTVAPDYHWGFVFGSLGIFSIGFADDIFQIRAVYRLVLQTAIAAIIIYLMNLSVTTIFVTPNWSFSLPASIGFIFSIFIILGAINSINMIDGLDGLASGVIALGFATLSILHYLIHKDVSLLLVISFPLLGSVLGFLKYNTHPANIFMGDGGSNWLGFVTGIFILLILKDQQLSSSAVALKSSSTTLISVILCIGIPVIDTATVVIKRLRARVHPMTADKRHFHHFLLGLGLNHHQCVTSIYFLCLITALVGILPNVYPRLNLWWTAYLYMGIICVLFFIANFKSELLSKLFTRSKFENLSDTPYSHLLKKWRRLNRYALYGILLFCPLFSGTVGREISYLALFAAIWIGLSLFFKKNQYDLFTQVIVALSIFVLLLLINQNPMKASVFGKVIVMQKYYNYLFIGLFVSTLLYFIVSISSKSIIISLSDFILIGIPLLLLLVSEPYYSKYLLGTVSLRCFVVFFVLRTFFGRKVEGFYRLRLIVFLGLIYVSLTSGLDFRIVY